MKVDLSQLKAVTAGEPEMTGAEMQEIRRRLGLSTTQLGRAFGYTGTDDTASMSIRRYESTGKNARAIPNYLARLLRMFDKHGVPDEFLIMWRKTPRE